MTYAKNTKVSVDKSQAEIRKILSKYGASAFAFAENNFKAVLQFELNSRRIYFVLPLPLNPDSFKNLADLKKYDQKVRTKWRSLLLAIKAKLECVESGITTFDQEFMAHIVLPNGKTVGEVVIPEIENSYLNNTMPPLLGMKGGEG